MSEARPLRFAALLLVFLVALVALLWLREGSGGRPLAPPAAPAAEPPAPAPGLDVAGGERQPVRPARGRSKAADAEPSDARRADGAPRHPAAPALRGSTLDARGRPLPGVAVLFDGAGPRAVGWAADGSRSSGAAPDVEAACRVVSDGAGEFVVEAFDPALATRPPRARLMGWTLLAVTPYHLGTDGSWEPLRLVLERSGPLVVVALDARDQPLAGLSVAADVLPGELSSLGLGASQLLAAPALRTDAVGEATFELPLGRRLAITASGEGWSRRAELRLGAEASSVDQPVEGAVPIVLDSPAGRRLVLRVGESVRLVGRVVLPDGRPVPRAVLRVVEGDPQASGWFDRRLVQRSDDEGRFELVLHGLARDAALTLIASDSPWVGMRGDLPRHAARRRVEVAAWLLEPRPLELVLERLEAISGRVLDVDREPVSAVVWAVPAGAPYLLQKGDLDVLPITLTQDGAFTLGGLAAGRYDLIVKRNRPRTYHRFADLAAGSSGHELVLAEDRDVRIRLVVEGARPGARMVPLLRWHQARDPGSFGEPLSASRYVVQGCDDAWWFAEEVPWRPAASERTANREHALGRTILLSAALRDVGPFEFEPQQVGTYCIGVRAWEPDGRPYAPRLSPPLRLAAGEYEFVVRLAPTTTLRGRVATAMGELLAAELRDARGRLVPQPDGAAFVRVTSEGAFAFSEVPVGEVEVRLGTPVELAAGRWRWARTLLAREGQELEVVLP